MCTGQSSMDAIAPLLTTPPPSPSPSLPPFVLTAYMLASVHSTIKGGGFGVGAGVGTRVWTVEVLDFYEGPSHKVINHPVLMDFAN